MKIIPKEQFLKTIWKNGGGITHIIEENSFYRLSIAEINTIGPFSVFENKTRLLFIWNGNGVVLNKIELKNKSIFKFSGDETINCDLLDSQVKDIGLIFNSTKLEAQMNYLKLFNLINYVNNYDQHIIINLGPTIKINSKDIKTGDAVFFDRSSLIEINVTNTSEILIFNLTLLA